MNNFESSIKTIEQAIQEAKIEKTDAYFYYILWGVLLFMYFFLGYLINANLISNNYFFGNYSWILFPIGGILSLLQKKKNKEAELKVVSNHEKVYLFAFTGFAMLYAFTLIHSLYIMYNYSIIIFPLLLGVTVYIVGGITKNIFSIIAGILSAICSVVSMYSSKEMHYLMAAIAVFIACIISGIIMKRKNA